MLVQVILLQKSFYLCILVFLESVDEFVTRPLLTMWLTVSMLKKALYVCVSGVCDLAKGSWVPDSRPPQYTNATCPFIQKHQDCIRNGRPDTGYLHWKWQPEHCELPRIDAKAFLNAMRNKSMYIVGDSLARNQFQSLLCLLSQVLIPLFYLFRLQDILCL